MRTLRTRLDLCTRRAGSARKAGGWRGLLTLLTCALLCAAFLTVSGGTATAANADTHRLSTWNMQRGTNRWQYALELSTHSDVVALQEAPVTPPNAARRLHGNYGAGISGYVIPGNRARGQRYLFILSQGNNPSLGVNPAMITSWLPDHVLNIDGVYRDALAVVNTTDSTMFASIHASATGGTDSGSLVRRVAAAAGTLGLQDWAVLGDFNRDPTTLPALGLPNGSHIYNSGMATQQSGGELDYMVSNVLTQNWQASRGVAHDSDHWPVTFSSLRAGANPTRFTISDHGNSSVLDVYAAQQANGTHIILYHPDSGTNQLWSLRTAGLYGQFDRLVSAASGKCMDVDNGTASTIGSQMNIWDCHNSSTANDTQEFALEHPVPLFPNLTTVENTQTELYLNVSENSNADGTPVIQYTQQYGQLPYPANNESFYFHPAVS